MAPLLKRKIQHLGNPSSMLAVPLLSLPTHRYTCPFAKYLSWRTKSITQVLTFGELTWLFSISTSAYVTGLQQPISCLFARSHWHHATSPCISILFRMGWHGWLTSAPHPPHAQGLSCGPSAPHCRHPLSLSTLGCNPAQLLGEFLGKRLGLALWLCNESFLGFPSTCFPPPTRHLPPPVLACL